MPWILAAAIAFWGSVGVQTEVPLGPADGEALDRALTEILRNVAAITAPGADRQLGVRRVVVTERAVNGYLRFQGAPLLPAGIANPLVRMEGSGRITARADVNLDELREQEERGVLDPLRYLSGTVPVTTVTVVRSDDRSIALDIDSVHVGSIPVPRAVLLELVRHHTRSERYPDGIDLTQTFPLPRGITAVRVEERRTVVVQ